MPQNTTNLDLLLYDSTADAGVYFSAYRQGIAGTTSSNMTKIDAWAGDINDDITDLQNNPSITAVPGVLTDGVYTATISTFTEYKTGSLIAFSVDTTNTGSVAINISSLGLTVAMKVDSTGTYVNLDDGDLKINKLYLFRYDGVRWVWVSATSGDQISMSGTSGNIVTISDNNTLEDSTMTYDSTVTASTIPVRNDSGNLQSNTPTADDDVVTLEYADDTFASQDDMDTVLDGGNLSAGDGIEITNSNAVTTITNKVATASTLGGIKVGSGLSITSDGTLSATAQKIYGIQIDMSNADSSTSVVYTDDAVGYTQASNTDIGSWQTFLDMLCKPVMLDFDGNVLYDLDTSNQTLKTDGTASDIADETFLGNAMVQFRRLWFKCYTDGSYNYWKFSFTQQDDTWTAYAYQNESGTPQEFIYMPMFNGYIDSSGRMRSISGVVPTASTTATAEQTACQTTGSNWYLETYDMRIMKMGLIWLLGKNLNSQAQFGNGAVSTTKQNTGIQVSTGAFAGSTSDSTTVVKTFYCENWWGNLLQRLEGVICTGRVMSVKHSPPFTFAGTDYTEIETITATGYVVNWNTANGNSPYFNNTTGGSATTYYSDRCYSSTTASVYVPLVGGSFSYTTNAGVSNWDCNNASSVAAAALGGSPHLIPL